VSHRRISGAALFAAISAAAAALVLATTAPAYAIANGTPVPKGQYRFAVKLTMTNIPRPDGSHYNSACSAALIAPQWIITAGHCFHDVNRNPVSGRVPYDTTAMIGRTDDADTDGYVVPVVAAYQSPANDVAVGQLAAPVHDIAPLRLSTAKPKIGEFLRVAGWGSLNDVDPVPATHLQTGQVKVVTVDSTTVGVTGYRPAPTTSACTYDSGAPYFYEPRHGAPRLVSVESDGPACPHDQVETTSRVDLLSWIHSTVHDQVNSGSR
jgi:secreted trypsin-like serine protease